nr:MAG TPA: hypothetical protein [Caudoviricetes sp.]
MLQLNSYKIYVKYIVLYCQYDKIKYLCVDNLMFNK